MKKLFRMFGVIVLLVTLVLISGSFTTSSMSDNEGNGVVVRVLTGPNFGGVMVLCPGEVEPEYYMAHNATLVYMDGVRVVWSFIVKLPKDCCAIPTDGAEVSYYDNGGMITVTPSGIATYRRILN